MILANARSRNTLSPLVAESKPRIRYAEHKPAHICVICDDVIGNGSDPAGGDTARSRTAWLAANRSAAAALSAASSASSWAEPRCSMLREPRRVDHTICTAVAPDAVFTVRT